MVVIVSLVAAGAAVDFVYQRGNVLRVVHDLDEASSMMTMTMVDSASDGAAVGDHQSRRHLGDEYWELDIEAVLVAVGASDRIGHSY